MIRAAWAQAATDPPAFLGIPPEALDVAQFGFVGAVLLCILARRWIVPVWALKDLKDSHAAERALLTERISGLQSDVVELKRTVTDLHAVYGAEVIPALVEANRLSAAHMSELVRRTS